MNTPIYTLIENTTTREQTLPWARNGHIWVGAKSTTKVPYEVWTQADDQIKTGLQSAPNGALKLSLMVLQEDGTYLTVPYCPAGRAAAPVAAAAPAVKPVTAKENAINRFAQEADHVVKARSEDGQHAASFFGMKKVAVDKPVAKVQQDTSIGFTKVEEEPDQVIEDPKEAVEEAVQEEPAVETAAEAPAVDSELDEAPGGVTDYGIDLDAYDAAVEAKQWKEVLQMLKDAFGDDIPVTTRMLASLKDASFDAVVRKYDLGKPDVDPEA